MAASSFRRRPRYNLGIRFTGSAFGFWINKLASLAVNGLRTTQSVGSSTFVLQALGALAVVVPVHQFATVTGVVASYPVMCHLGHLRDPYALGAKVYTLCQYFYTRVDTMLRHNGT